MARGITETDVWQAADALLLAGERPTIERIRQHLGRGSPNTVSPHLDTWFRGLGARIADPQAFAAPAAFPDAIQQAAAHFWQVALATARAQIGSELTLERERLIEAQAQLEKERLVLSQEGDLQAARQEGLMTAMRATEALLQTANERILSMEQQLAASSREITELQAQTDSLANDRDALRKQMENERFNHEAVRAKMEERAAAHEQRWSLEVDRSREAAKQAQAQLAKTEKAQAEHLAAWDTARDRLEVDLVSMTESAAKHQLQAEHAKAALSLMEGSLAAASNAAEQREAALHRQAERLQNQLSGALEQLRIKDGEQSLLLRTLVEKASDNGKLSSGRKAANKKAPLLSK